MNTKVVGISIAAFIGIVVLASVLMPVLDDATGTKEFYNDGTYRMSPVGEGTVVIEYANDVVTVNGVTYNYSARPITQGTVMFYETAHSQRVGYLYITSDDGYTRANVNRTDTMTMTYDGSTKICNIKTTHNGTDYESDNPYVGEVYYADPEGEYVWAAEKPGTIYIPSDWDRFNTWSDGADYFYAIIEQDILVNGVAAPEGTTTTMELSDVQGYSGIKTIDTYTLNLPDADPIACRGYIVPYAVLADNVSLGSSEQILLVVPMIVIVAILLGVIALVIRSRLD